MSINKIRAEYEAHRGDNKANFDDLLQIANEINLDRVYSQYEINTILLIMKELSNLGKSVQNAKV